LAYAEGLMPEDDLVLTTRAHLCLRESLAAASRQEALELRTEANGILTRLVEVVSEGVEME
jgi:hypothetical protein